MKNRPRRVAPLKTYACPMHPEVRQARPGNCPECGMKLALSNSPPAVRHNGAKSVGTPSWKDYLPLAAIISLIVLTSAAISLKDYSLGRFTIANALSYFMAGFFLVFGGFKLIDLAGFAHGYSTYDLLASRVFAYGYAYPFIELFFGLAMILAPASKPLLVAEFFLMAFSGIGVVFKLLKREKFECVCLGTFLKVPLTKITVVEDFGMAALALAMLLLTA